MAGLQIKRAIVWNEITGKEGSAMPDAEKEILVYDGFLDDTVIGCLDVDANDKHVWCDVQTDQVLTDPQFWAEKPYPADK